jgi:hypothetical protein
MSSLGKTVLTGASGELYRFRVYPLGTKFRKKSGVYVITNRYHNDGGRSRHSALFVGQTEDVSQPFETHRHRGALTELGANCICLHADESEESRLKKEHDLVAALHPKCNESDRA